MKIYFIYYFNLVNVAFVYNCGEEIFNSVGCFKNLWEKTLKNAGLLPATKVNTLKNIIYIYFIMNILFLHVFDYLYNISSFREKSYLIL